MVAGAVTVEMAAACLTKGPAAWSPAPSAQIPRARAVPAARSPGRTSLATWVTAAPAAPAEVVAAFTIAPLGPPRNCATRSLGQTKPGPAARAPAAQWRTVLTEAAEEALTSEARSAIW